eukprot:GDKJ01023971.1.p1 GENE.GDKJ01023971.1~~GDKJ01023971.1.p1  ORF type:complete len:1499 (+),score=377.22 GDKJ01023971.1:1003-5499(+)
MIVIMEKEVQQFNYLTFNQRLEQILFMEIPSLSEDPLLLLILVVASFTLALLLFVLLSANCRQACSSANHSNCDLSCHQKVVMSLHCNDAAIIHATLDFYSRQTVFQEQQSKHVETKQVHRIGFPKMPNLAFTCLLEIKNTFFPDKGHWRHDDSNLLGKEKAIAICFNEDLLQTPSMTKRGEKSNETANNQFTHEIWNEIPEAKKKEQHQEILTEFSANPRVWLSCLFYWSRLAHPQSLIRVCNPVRDELVDIHCEETSETASFSDFHTRDFSMSIQNQKTCDSALKSCEDDDCCTVTEGPPKNSQQKPFDSHLKSNDESQIELMAASPVVFELDGSSPSHLSFTECETPRRGEVTAVSNLYFITDDRGSERNGSEKASEVDSFCFESGERSSSVIIASHSLEETKQHPTSKRENEIQTSHPIDFPLDSVACLFDEIPIKEMEEEYWGSDEDEVKQIHIRDDSNHSEKSVQVFNTQEAFFSSHEFGKDLLPRLLNESHSDLQCLEEASNPQSVSDAIYTSARPLQLQINETSKIVGENFFNHEDNEFIPLPASPSCSSVHDEHSLSIDFDTNNVEATPAVLFHELALRELPAKEEEKEEGGIGPTPVLLVSEASHSSPNSLRRMSEGQENGVPMLNSMSSEENVSFKHNKDQRSEKKKEKKQVSISSVSSSKSEVKSQMGGTMEFIQEEEGEEEEGEEVEEDQPLPLLYPFNNHFLHSLEVSSSSSSFALVVLEDGEKRSNSLNAESSTGNVLKLKQKPLAQKSNTITTRHRSSLTDKKKIVPPLLFPPNPDPNLNAIALLEANKNPFFSTALIDEQNILDKNNLKNNNKNIANKRLLSRNLLLEVDSNLGPTPRNSAYPYSSHQHTHQSLSPLPLRQPPLTYLLPFPLNQTTTLHSSQQQYQSMIRVSDTSTVIPSLVFPFQQQQQLQTAQPSQGLIVAPLRFMSVNSTSMTINNNNNISHSNNMNNNYYNNNNHYNSNRAAPCSFSPRASEHADFEEVGSVCKEEFHHRPCEKKKDKEKAEENTGYLTSLKMSYYHRWMYFQSEKRVNATVARGAFSRLKILICLYFTFFVSCHPCAFILDVILQCVRKGKRNRSKLQHVVLSDRSHIERCVVYISHQIFVIMFFLLSYNQNEPPLSDSIQGHKLYPKTLEEFHEMDKYFPSIIPAEFTEQYNLIQSSGLKKQSLDWKALYSFGSYEVGVDTILFLLVSVCISKLFLKLIDFLFFKKFSPVILQPECLEKVKNLAACLFECRFLNHTPTRTEKERQSVRDAYLMHKHVTSPLISREAIEDFTTGLQSTSRFGIALLIVTWLGGMFCCFFYAFAVGYFSDKGFFIEEMVNRCVGGLLTFYLFHLLITPLFETFIIVTMFKLCISKAISRKRKDFEKTMTSSMRSRERSKKYIYFADDSQNVHSGSFCLYLFHIQMKWILDFPSVMVLMSDFEKSGESIRNSSKIQDEIIQQDVAYPRKEEAFNGENFISLYSRVYGNWNLQDLNVDQ